MAASGVVPGARQRDRHRIEHRQHGGWSGLRQRGHSVPPLGERHRQRDRIRIFGRGGMGGKRPGRLGAAGVGSNGRLLRPVWARVVSVVFQRPAAGSTDPAPVGCSGLAGRDRVGRGALRHQRGQRRQCVPDHVPADVDHLRQHQRVGIPVLMAGQPAGAHPGLPGARDIRRHPGGCRPDGPRHPAVGVTAAATQKPRQYGRGF